MAVDPPSGTHLPRPDELPNSSLWRNGAFRRLWTASTISVFGSLVTRLAIPFLAILTLDANAFDIALLRSMDLIAGLAVGLVAGAWVDRLRRRPVMIWTDMGRAVLLATIPISAIGGWLSLGQLLVVALLTAALTTFFDVADNAYLPTIVPRRELMRANGALTATGSVSEFAAFGSAGFLVQLLSAPLTIAIDAVSFVVSALFIGSIRVKEPPPPPKADREPVLQEIATGLRLVIAHPILRALTLASMAMAGLWGVFGATWYLFAFDVIGLDAATIGVIAAAGGASSLVGAVLASRLGRRVPLGRLLMGTMLMAALGHLFIPLAPVGAPLIAIAFFLGQQLIADSAATVYDIVEVSIRQSIVGDRQLGRVNATVHVATLLAQLVCTLGAGALALYIGLRETTFLAPLGGVLAAIFLWASPVRRMKQIEPVDTG
ncbi:MAG: MFS transporter [Candidatus Limnocylindrales bacterium]